MLAIGLQQAKNYSKKPCLIARNLNDESSNIYWVEDAALPCISCKENVLSLVTKQELFKLKKKLIIHLILQAGASRFRHNSRGT